MEWNLGPGFRRLPMVLGVRTVIQKQLVGKKTAHFVDSVLNQRPSVFLVSKASVWDWLSYAHLPFVFLWFIFSFKTVFI